MYQKLFRICKDCDEKRICRKCKEPLPQSNFTPNEWKKATWTRTTQGNCKACITYNVEEKICSVCKRLKSESQFSGREWRKSDEDRRCLACQRRRSKPGEWECKKCKKSLPRAQFAQWLEKRTNKNRVDGMQRCNTCKDSESAVEQEMARRNVEMCSARK